MTQYRIESDSMGEVKVPASALYGSQTQRAIANFVISGIPMPGAFIRALGEVKRAAAIVNGELGLLEKERAKAIVMASQEIVEGKHSDQFPVDLFQTGSGTSTNMNVNEVIAHLASKELDDVVDPNDHVNLGQSSNDVIPTAIHISAAVAIQNSLLPALEHLIDVTGEKAAKVFGEIKTGRTHLMDAMPIRLSQELRAWATQIEQSVERLKSLLPQLLQLTQGGTAVGTGVNAHSEFAERFCREISTHTGLNFQASENFFASQSSQDVAVSLSGELRSLSVAFTKICNDLRWMNSGPLTGLAEIELEALQPGSSIMPGKTNPVIPEAVLMVAAQVVGNDATIALAGQSGNFQLNVMLPVIAYNLLQSIQLLTNSAIALADKAIKSFSVNSAVIRDQLAQNPILATALAPQVGYLKAAEIAKQAYRQRRPIIDVAEELTGISKSELEVLLDPGRLADGG